MKRKPRILWLGEASFLNSGYAVYGREVLTRLHATGKYELAELGVYGKWDDPRAHELPWRYYGNLPDTQEHEQKYFSDNLNQFGQWKFEEVCLDFKPDIVWDIRDWWMGEYADRSPFRPFYHWCIMPTVDSIPQQEQWLSTYMHADSVFAYTEFSRDYLQDDTNGKIKVLGMAPPAADTDIFKPVKDKEMHRREYGFMPDIFIIGTVMRNQRRKLYPDLIESFKAFLKTQSSSSKKFYLYIHASYPDNGWDMARLVRESGISHNILFTYICGNCKFIFPSFFQDAIQVCPRCKRPRAGLPNVHVGVTPEQMAAILNWFDVYVQYSICEGFGIPQVEAAACGVPIIAVDYSGMESVLRNLKGYPVKVERFFTEPESGSKRALPDNSSLIQHLKTFFNLPETMRLKRGRDAYHGCLKHYGWDKTAEVWEKHFDQIELKDLKETWQSQPRIYQPNTQIPDRLNNSDFVRWTVANILREPDKVDSYMALRMIRDLNYGHKVVTTGGFFFNEDSLHARNRYRRFTRQDAIEEMLKMIRFRHYWEERRTGIRQEDKPLFILNTKRAR